MVVTPLERGEAHSTGWHTSQLLRRRGVAHLLPTRVRRAGRVGTLPLNEGGAGLAHFPALARRRGCTLPTRGGAVLRGGFRPGRGESERPAWRAGLTGVAAGLVGAAREERMFATLRINPLDKAVNSSFRRKIGFLGVRAAPCGRSRAGWRAPSLKSPPEGERPEGRPSPNDAPETAPGQPRGLPLQGTIRAANVSYAKVSRGGEAGGPPVSQRRPGDHPRATTRVAPTGMTSVPPSRVAQRSPEGERFKRRTGPVRQVLQRSPTGE